MRWSEGSSSLNHRFLKRDLYGMTFFEKEIKIEKLIQ
jgi:hypothetical protein